MGGINYSMLIPLLFQFRGGLDSPAPVGVQCPSASCEPKGAESTWKKREDWAFGLKRLWQPRVLRGIALSPGTNLYVVVVVVVLI